MIGQGWAGVVLAGGMSRRMGRDKALIPYRGTTLLEHALNLLRPCSEELLVVGDPERYGHYGSFAIADDSPGLGPLGGIVTALRYTWCDRIMVLACDMPGVTAELITFVQRTIQEGDDACVPQCDGRLEPLVAAYRRSSLPTFQEQLSQGRSRMSDAVERVRSRYVQVCAGEEGWPPDLFRNLNLPDDL